MWQGRLVGWFCGQCEKLNPGIQEVWSTFTKHSHSGFNTQEQCFANLCSEVGNYLSSSKGEGGSPGMADYFFYFPKAAPTSKRREVESLTDALQDLPSFQKGKNSYQRPLPCFWSEFFFVIPLFLIQFICLREQRNPWVGAAPIGEHSLDSTRATIK